MCIFNEHQGDRITGRKMNKQLASYTFEHKNTEGVGVAVTLETRILEVLDLYFGLCIVVFLSPCRKIRGCYID
jgi:hypothetical protein